MEKLVLNWGRGHKGETSPACELCNTEGRVITQVEEGVPEKKLVNE